LPQLINIVKGDMSFVGPRPVVPDELAEYGAYRLMYEAAFPGLTGAWQVNGRESMKYPARAEMDADYVEGWTFWGDMAIMLRTVPAVLAPQRSISPEPVIEV
jgi:exopolysaccharide production protein ExoY